MKITGQDLIVIVSERLVEEGILCYDSNILKRIRELSSEELMQILSFGNAIIWHNEKIKKKNTANDR